jgi:hypothetical protein
VSSCTLRTHVTPWSQVLPEKPPVARLIKNFTTFYGNRRFITMFTRVRCWSLSWARWIQSITPHPISLRSIFSAISLFWKNKSRLMRSPCCVSVYTP